VAKTAKSKKAKGSKLEKKIAEEYRRIGIEARRMPLSGAISHMKSDIWKKTRDGWSDECKNAETVKLKEWWAQTRRDASTFNKPVLHVSANYRPIISIISAEDYYQMLLTLQQSGQEFQHRQRKLTKKRFSLWNEWSELWAEDGFGDPLLIIEGYAPEDLVVMQVEHYFELRDCLNHAKIRQ
jgi:hypothetical protein